MEVGGEEENSEEKLGNVGHRSTSAQELLEWKRRCSQGNERLDPFQFPLLRTGTRFSSLGHCPHCPSLWIERETEVLRVGWLVGFSV